MKSFYSYLLRRFMSFFVLATLTFVVEILAVLRSIFVILLARRPAAVLMMAGLPSGSFDSLITDFLYTVAF